MAQQGVGGPCLVHWTVQDQARPRDFSHLASEGITVIGRLCYGYADGTGTLPPGDKADAFVRAAVETIRRSKGVTFWHVGNEVNNWAEWPDSPVDFEMTPEYVAAIYNEIYRGVGMEAMMGPPPIDPYYGPNSDNRTWWRTILNNIDGAEALFLHCKTQTNDPDEVWSTERFSDWPLEWQYLHLRTAETSLVEVPDEFARLPVFITELNPQHKTAIGGVLGWVEGNGRWVEEAVGYFDWLRGQGWRIEGVCAYRFEDADAWGLRNRGAILGRIRELASGGE
jgi:hypothetical protein